MGVSPTLTFPLSGADKAWTIATLRLALTEIFKTAGIESPDVDARLLVEHGLGIGRTELMVNGSRAVTAAQLASVEALAQRRLAHEPVARILGVKEFWSLPLQVSAAVLVPRPDTETVVEAALDFVTAGGLRTERLRLLDIGTGSGALLLALLSELPNALGLGTDISAAALAVARGNAERNGLASRCSFAACDIATGISGLFDLIVSNPPYIAHGDIAALEPEVRDFDPALALDGPPPARAGQRPDRGTRGGTGNGGARAVWRGRINHKRGAARSGRNPAGAERLVNALNRPCPAL
jgi:release factor glutamine methyltransferase